MMLDTFKVYPGPRTEEARLYRRARSGDRAAFSELVQSVDIVLFGLLAQLFGDPARARNAWPKALRSAYDDRRQWPPDASFAVWLIAHVLDGVRVHSRYARHERQIAREDRYAEPEDERRRGRLAPLAGRRDLRVITVEGRGLEQLPDRTRVLVYLRIHAGFSVESLAVILALTPVEVSVRLFQATEMVRRFRVLADQESRAQTDPEAEPVDHDLRAARADLALGFGRQSRDCLRARELRALVQDGDLEAETLARYREHLRNCQLCLEYAVHVVGLEQNLRGLYREEAASPRALRSLTDAALAEPPRRRWFRRSKHDRKSG